MIKAVMQVDLDNTLALQYLELALKSYECVSDIFEIEVVQCVTPDTLLPELANIPDHPRAANRSPQEIASIHSNYRMIKRISEGERFWVLEHDAYLRPEHEETFRMLMSKWQMFPSAELGMANEFYTMWPEIAKLWCDVYEQNGYVSGPMGTLHRVTDSWCRRKKWNRRTIYWPCDWSLDPRWVNMTGVANSVSASYRDPYIIINSPITQLMDEKHGGTVTDRKKQQKNGGGYILEKLYSRDVHPDAQWVDLDTKTILS
jgi:hypothetical protein